MTPDRHILEKSKTQGTIINPWNPSRGFIAFNLELSIWWEIDKEIIVTKDQIEKDQLPICLIVKVALPELPDFFSEIHVYGLLIEPDKNAMLAYVYGSEMISQAVGEMEDKIKVILSLFPKE